MNSKSRMQTVSVSNELPAPSANVLNADKTSADHTEERDPTISVNSSSKEGKETPNDSLIPRVVDSLRKEALFAQEGQGSEFAEVVERLENLDDVDGPYYAAYRFIIATTCPSLLWDSAKAYSRTHGDNNDPEILLVTGPELHLIEAMLCLSAGCFKRIWGTSLQTTFIRNARWRYILEFSIDDSDGFNQLKFSGFKTENQLISDNKFQS